MHPADTRSTVLQDGDRVAVVGGGPAGSFFAYHLLREARRLKRSLDVVILEKKHGESSAADDFQRSGCNSCAGGISPRLDQILAQHDLGLPGGIIEGRIDYVWVHGQWKNFRLKVPSDMAMYSVFRGSLPTGRSNGTAGLDDFLLSRAIAEGARLMRGKVQSIAYGPSGTAVLKVHSPATGLVSLDSSFVAIATGINARGGLADGGDGLAASLRRLNPEFTSGRSRQALIFELDVGEDYLVRTMHREIHFIEYGSKHLDLEHTALLPKGRFLTVAMIGRCVDEAVLPRDSRRIIEEFLALPQVRRILPGIGSAPVACVCSPQMSVTPATSPFGDRFAVIGDAVGSRLNKDGLFSAHVTATRLAEAVLHDGIDRSALSKRYGRTIDWLAADNRYGRVVFGVSRFVFAKPLASRVAYQAFATEFKVRDERNRPVALLLWKIASGTSDYREVLREMLSPRLLRSVFVGAGVTLGNMAVERMLGLRWGEYGRYPTVVLKEKRRTVKEDLEARLGTPLGDSPDFERMYVIKIGGSKDEIMRRLAKFGDVDAPFLNPRLVKVRRVEGAPNQVGSVIRYGTPIPGVNTKLRLTSTGHGETLLFELDERLTEHGRLVIDVAPTRDGNCKLTVYAAFDFKRGRGLTRILWRIMRGLFPEFVHDIVWNHALCTIKEHVEQRADYPKSRSSGDVS
jgi:flavin-dependent dehydrogenase